MVPDPSAPLSDALLLEHRHRLLLAHLPGLDSRINRAAGTRIAKTVGEVAVELRETRLENKRVREGKERKGAAEYFRENLTHLLNLVQVNNAQDIPPCLHIMGDRSTIYARVKAWQVAQDQPVPVLQE